MKCYGQYRAWGDVYGSVFRQRTIKSSNVLVSWVVSGEKRVDPGQIMKFVEIESSVPGCAKEIVRLARTSAVDCPSPKKRMIGEARDVVATLRTTAVHRFACIRWYKADRRARSAHAPTIWWRDKFQDPDHRFVPLTAIVGGFIQYPLPYERDPSEAKFVVIEIPRRLNI